VSSHFTDRDQILIINSSNGTSHIFELKKPSKVNETPITKSHHQDDPKHKKIYHLTAKTRFKYKSLISQGEIKVYSLISQQDSCSPDSEGALCHRVLTYTSKNEFYVIDIKKTKSHSQSVMDDDGIQGADADSDEGT